MGKPSRASQEKRARERAQKMRKMDKIEQRTLRKDGDRTDRQAAIDQGLDPDLIGIRPGPQPIEDV